MSRTSATSDQTSSRFVWLTTPRIVAEAQVPLELVGRDRPPSVEVSDPCGHIHQEALTFHESVELRRQEQDPSGLAVLRDDHGRLFSATRRNHRTA